MDKIVVKGLKQLNGEIHTGGAKNSALPLLFSTLLADGKHVFKNVPKLQDINSTQLLLEHLGAKVSWEGDNFIVECKGELIKKAPYELVRKMRASILCLGPILARYGEAVVSLPGGCAIGTRPIDKHLDAMKTLGAEIEIQEGYVIARSKKLKGATIVFDGVTVGGTENALMAAVLADGVTTIENAAKEPEVDDLANYLVKMGAKIEGIGSSILKITGVEKLKAAEHTVIPDRIEAGTLLIAGAITGGEVTVTKCVPTHLDALIAKMKESGFKIDTGKDFITVRKCSSWKGVDVQTTPYPGFATDLQAQFMALMTVAEGTSIISENIFENRFMHVQELVRMNADITSRTQVAIVRGKKGKLTGAPVMATDLRASASLILAGLASQGETQVLRVYHLDRGYEKLEEKLQKLGADAIRAKE
ncbi:MAG: UDP-N-acetylglucosamine 1-carboxyvinyltransferase [Bdellovibrionota bacterium]